MPSTNPPPFVLAAYYWSPYLTLAVLCGERVIETVCRRVTRNKRTLAATERCFRVLVNDYAPTHIVVPPILALDEAARRTGLPTVMMNLSVAKSCLTGSRLTTNRDLYRFLVARFPELRCLVTVLVGNGDVAATEPWRTAQLLPIALGLAVQRLSTERTTEEGKHS